MNTTTQATNKDVRQFGFIMAGGLILIFGLFFPWLQDRPMPQWPYIAGAVFAGTGLMAPVVLKPVHLLWLKIGHVLGYINARIILGFIFFVIFLPIGLVFRMIGKDPMARRLDKHKTTYRVISQSSPREQLERPF